MVLRNLPRLKKNALSGEDRGALKKENERVYRRIRRGAAGKSIVGSFVGDFYHENSTKVGVLNARTDKSRRMPYDTPYYLNDALID